MIRTTIVLDNDIKDKMVRYCKTMGYSHSGLISFLLKEKMGDFE